MKKEAIQQIELLYPPDSKFRGTRMVGISLLEEAKQNVAFDWRDYPENVLVELAKLCSTEHSKFLK